MDSNNLKRKDTTKGPPLRILSLDGGGVRGYSIFIILQEVMHRTFVEMEGRAPHRNEIPKPADHFDLIVGTGTGGLIALMLGRLRLDIETCKELYVRLTRMVFETDKTILGIPTRSTVFKASKLEEAIMEAVREHTVNENEGKDSRSGSGSISSPLGAGGGSRTSSVPRRHASNASVVSFSARSPAAQMARPYFFTNNYHRGDPNALLYDARECRTKTVVTATYKGAPRGEEPVMLRSYDSRREPAPEFDCRIWEAGRATCSIGLAFKPIQIGQSVFHDDGAGTFNPSPFALDEATVNEWPGREVGVFLSVGTGKRPAGSDNNPMWYEGFLGEFAEARRRLVAKIEGCEKTHNEMVREHLSKRGVNVENYYRLNVEVGVGEFGMNEWHRLAEISTSTKRYLSRHKERGMVQSSAVKLAKIHRAHTRLNKQMTEAPEQKQQQYMQYLQSPEISMPLAVELPADVPTVFSPSGSSAVHTPRQSYESNNTDRLSVANNGSPSPRSSADRFQQQLSTTSELASTTYVPPKSSGSSGQTRAHSAGGPSGGDDHLTVSAPTPEQWRYAAADTRRQAAAQAAAPATYRVEPPPLPPKTPLPEGNGRPSSRGGERGGRRRATYTSTGVAGSAPYPLDDDERPPPVNKARKPEYRSR
ncbi:lipid acyl hydrolase [Grosmannia clavigera kw1407]|uniref:Lipid acyl hydrolase n=1 Tax=Grosmannia clavigera (strain kw1407 / UAMH 11150) TaxID=655863 RepID=F0XGK0_GROCL|nr:lipid acyl hydrolase [Grosmannia clavigera kw1407]EFX03124.1 lipid acyl hydrolase [Grosmannia clavigera kw1407]